MENDAGFAKRAASFFSSRKRADKKRTTELYIQ